MLIGYARTSIGNQHLKTQIETLKSAGCTKVFEDCSDDGTIQDAGLHRARRSLRKGDTLVVCNLDRLGSSVRRLVALVSDLHENGCHLTSLSDAIDTTTKSGSFFFHIMLRLAEMEQNLVRERTRPGLQTARRLGRRGGRTPRMTESKLILAKQKLANGLSFRDAAEAIGVSVATLYRWIPASKVEPEIPDNNRRMVRGGS